MNLFAKWILFFFLISSFQIANSTHLRCGEITVRQVGEAGARTYKIRVTVYTNTNNTSVMFGGDQDYLDFGDGSAPLLVPVIEPGHPNYEYIDPVRGIAKAYYEIQYNYAGPGWYTVSYTEPNRNTGIINIGSSENTPFYLETQFLCESGLNYSSPTFLTPPVFLAQAGQPYSYSLAAEDPNDYTLFYSLATPGRVSNFRLPDETDINDLNGLLTWSGMFQEQALSGEFLLAVKVHQYKGNRRIGYCMRDVQIIAQDSDTELSVSDDHELDENERLFVPPAENEKIKLIAHGGEEISMTLFSPFAQNPEVVSLETYDSLGGQLKVGNLTIACSEEILRDNPYIITIRTSFKVNMNIYTVDRNYMFYSKDVEIQEPIILDVTETPQTINIFPNPARDFIKVEGLDKYNAQLLDLSGHPVPLIFYDENHIDLRFLPAGVYVVQQKSNKTIRYQRLMKE